MHSQHPGGPSQARPNDPARAPELGVAALAFELRQAGAGERGLGFALRTLGADRVLEELRRRSRFGARCRRRGTRALDRDERAAWTILAACGPVAIERRLERDGLIRRNRRSGRRRRDAAAPRMSGEEGDVVLLRGRAEFGAGADRTPFQEQLAELALTLAEAA
jgi:hypothetical protein